jgi:cytochrome c551/c552
MKNWLLLGFIAVMSAVPGYAQAGGTSRQRALIDQYCVTCHNDRTKTANLSLQNLDLATAGDNPQLWERVVRKMRAGVMPPPGARRPSVAEYDALRDWLETEIDRKARQNPGSKVLHRLNRIEYANAIRDLLDLEIDAETLLPPDDSARGFDNIAGSLRYRRRCWKHMCPPRSGLRAWRSVIGKHRRNRPTLRRATLRRLSRSKGCLSAPAAECSSATTFLPTASTGSR